VCYNCNLLFAFHSGIYSLKRVQLGAWNLELFGCKDTNWTELAQRIVSNGRRLTRAVILSLEVIHFYMLQIKMAEGTRTRWVHILLRKWRLSMQSPFYLNSATDTALGVVCAWLIAALFTDCDK
jgi:hypothetical protein